LIFTMKVLSATIPHLTSSARHFARHSARHFAAVYFLSRNGMSDVSTASYSN
jgi:hypothetical protein